MEKQFISRILEVTHAQSATVDCVIQSLWSGYGEIVRVRLESARCNSVVVKWVAPPDKVSHPRGWNTPLSHQRKLHSYQVEMAWYQHWSSQCDRQCKVPNTYLVEQIGNNSLMVLEDLDDSGYSLRKTQLNKHEVMACLNWLANFHGRFFNKGAEGLWSIGTYWHLDTRPNEWEAMKEGRLKKAAHSIDQCLSSCRFQTLVHGDAKLANFCFSENRDEVAAVDFQYVGAGCGIKDVVYFLGSCLDEKQCYAWEQELLDFYFDCLQHALMKFDSQENFAELELEWRKMYPIAWADFHRFLQGWMPDHWKINNYMQEQCEQALSYLNY